jgi:hypothetical protein
LKEWGGGKRRNYREVDLVKVVGKIPFLPGHFGSEQKFIF